jgi:hypothetical protein
MNTLLYVLLFAAIQAAAAVLFIVGVPVCALYAYLLPNRRTKSRTTGLPIMSFPKWAWVWSNDEDGVYPPWYHRVNPSWSYSRTIFVWTALRNPVNNLRYVPGVSKVGRPLWRKEFGKWYAQAGWNGAGNPVFSAGKNIYYNA